MRHCAASSTRASRCASPRDQLTRSWRPRTGFSTGCNGASGRLPARAPSKQADDHPLRADRLGRAPKRPELYESRGFVYAAMQRSAAKRGKPAPGEARSIERCACDARFLLQRNIRKAPAPAGSDRAGGASSKQGRPSCRSLCTKRSNKAVSQKQHEGWGRRGPRQGRG